VEDEEEVEEPPTAMEVALRKAMSDEPDAPPEEEVSQTQPKKSQNALEDILSRTLQQRVKTSTGDE
jgi:hypothetical protein